jgi:1-Cys peroxiredoxin 6
MKLGDVFPNFDAETNEGPIKFYDWLGDSWGILFSHPADYTPVCTTELGRAAKLKPEFDKRNVKMIALSCDNVESHRGWIKDIEGYCPDLGAGGFKIPIIADPKRELAVQFGMLDPDEIDAAGIPLTARALFVVGPDKKLKLSILYPATTGRNFTEVLRVIDSLQLTAIKKVATPANWNMGDPAMVIPSLSDEEAKELFPGGFKTEELPSGRRYLRMTTDYV